MTNFYTQSIYFSMSLQYKKMDTFDSSCESRISKQKNEEFESASEHTNRCEDRWEVRGQNPLKKLGRKDLACQMPVFRGCGVGCEEGLGCVYSP